MKQPYYFCQIEIQKYVNFAKIPGWWNNYICTSQS